MPDKNKIQAVITLACRQLSLGVNTNLASPLMATDYKEPQVVCVHGTQDPCTTENVAHTLGCNNGQENALVYPINTMTCQGRPSDDLNPRMGLGIGQETDPCPTLTKAHSHAVAYGIPSNWIGRKPENGGNATEPPLELSPCLTVADVHAVSSLMQVRRLTPKECERLQGFPDDYTLVQHNKKIATDSPRYKALGNSMAVPVMHWIGQRIQQHLKKEVAA